MILAFWFLGFWASGRRGGSEAAGGGQPPLSFPAKPGEIFRKSLLVSLPLVCSRLYRGKENGKCPHCTLQGVAQDQRYLVMRYIEGASLAQGVKEQDAQGVGRSAHTLRW